MAEDSKLDYEHELGNGWGRYQLLVLGEMKRLADHAEKMESLLTAHQIQFATIGEQNSQRDAVLTELTVVCKGLRTDVDTVKETQSTAKTRLGTTTRLLGVSIAVFAWCVSTALGAYATLTG